MDQEKSIARPWVTTEPSRLVGRGHPAGDFLEAWHFEPIVGPKVILDSRREKQRGRTHVVLTRFLQGDELAVLAATTMREVELDRQLGDA